MMWIWLTLIALLLLVTSCWTTEQPVPWDRTAIRRELTPQLQRFGPGVGAQHLRVKSCGDLELLGDQWQGGEWLRFVEARTLEQPRKRERRFDFVAKRGHR